MPNNDEDLEDVGPTDNVIKKGSKWRKSSMDKLEESESESEESDEDYDEDASEESGEGSAESESESEESEDSGEVESDESGEVESDESGEVGAEKPESGGGSTGASGEGIWDAEQQKAYEEEYSDYEDDFSFTNCATGLGMGFIGIIYILYGFKRNYTLLIVCGFVMMGIGYQVETWQNMFLSALGVLVVAFLSGKRFFRR